ncbi:MAG TPA: HAD-IIIA family hydrolase [Verrucomicrobiales bacterium]|nr:HAD-IIIA family hydrolase [Verrucomicrobiales bacterium]
MPANGPAGRPCVFFDRDGVVNDSPGRGYVARWEDFRFREGIASTLSRLAQRGWLRVLVTNQQGIAKGMMTENDLDQLHLRMQRELASRGAAFNAIYTAVGFEGRDPRRKPSPLMLQEAARHLGLDLTRSWTVGDDDRDILAGRRAGTRTIRIAGRTAPRVPADFTLASPASLPRLFDCILAGAKP